jgi:hypothetical protein
LAGKLLAGRARERGYIMMVTILVVLGMILGSIAIASRTTSGLQAARSQAKNREARDIAESGVTEIISELNREENRRLLVTPKADWSSAIVNPCELMDSNGAPITISATPPTSTALAYGNAWNNLTSSDATKQFRLISTSGSNMARTTPLTATLADAQSRGTEKTLIRITVTGRINDSSGNTMSSSTITREYEVVPKCCKRSFGRNYGKDSRSCFASGALGVVVGLNGGTLNTSNNSFNITDNNGLPVTRVLCDDGPPNPPAAYSACNNGTLRLGSSTSVVPTDFNTPFPPYPGSIRNSGPINVESRSGSNRTTRAYVRPNGSAVEQCTITIAGGALSQCVEIPTCEKLDNEYYCRLTTIDSNGDTVFIDSSNGKINLYFDDPNATASTRYSDLSGNGAIAHVRCPSITTTTACVTQAQFADVENLNIFISGSGTFQLKGTSSALAINIFNLNGLTDMNGGGNANPNFIGRIWTKSMSVNGSVSMVVPDSKPEQFCPTRNCPAAGYTDWVARSITHSSNF